MRKIVTIISFVLLLANMSKAQYVTLQDENFRNYLRNLYPTCFNAAGQMDTTCSMIVNETRLDCSTMPPGLPDYSDLTPLYYFKNLKYLDCSANYADCSSIRFAETLDTLIVSFNYGGPAILPPALKILQCWLSYNTSLPTLPATLLSLTCGENNLTSLAPLPPSLQSLHCGYNSLTSLPALPASLTDINCDRNRLVSLPTLPLALQTLSCSENLLVSLPALPGALNYLSAGINQLSSLPQLPASLSQLYVWDNRLAQLPALPSSLSFLDVRGNNLTGLPTLPLNLSGLRCSYNQLVSLPQLPENLGRIEAQGNNMYCLPWLPALSSQLLIDDKIKCLPNKPANLTLIVYDNIGEEHFYDLPLCSPVTNANQCSAYPVMSGKIFIDNNNNGVFDAGEYYKQNCLVKTRENNLAFTNKNGDYEISTDSAGPCTLTAAAPKYFAAAPVSFNYNFTTYDTLVTGNFAMQATTVVDEITVKITPINWAARPGFSFPYLLSYENTGTTTLSSNITFDYDQTKLDYNTSSEPGVVDNTYELTFSTGSLVPGQSGSFIGYFTLKTTIPLGDTLNAKAIISANTFTAYDSVITTVRGAFDPNDKQATPQLSPSQVANGKYIDYTIRFQNTGTDTAFTVVISDTLSDDLQTNTLQMIASSHNCKATIKDNIVFFEFLNILLPDSNVNEPKSHGFVSFRIKPQTTVSVNTTIPNSAAIYFDYNAPVITNTATTLIKEFTVVPLKLISFSAVPQNDNTVLLYWNTANEINTKHFVIERSNDGRSFNAVSTVFAKGKANNNYSATVANAITGIGFYRLKMVDNDGTFSYSPVIKIDDRKNAAGLSILSNPVNNYLVISSTDRALNNTQANIINTQGAVVKTFIIKQGSQTIAINDLPNGVYYLRTVNGSNRFMLQ